MLSVIAVLHPVTTFVLARTVASFYRQSLDSRAEFHR
jgi:hypothetical protein